MASPKVNRCPTCRQPLLPEFTLPPVKERIFDAVKNRPGIDAQAIIAKLDNPISTDAVRSHISQINKVLQPHGLRITGIRKGRKGRYRIEKESG